MSNNHGHHRIVFMGTPRFAELILNSLAQSEFRPLLVITEPDKPAGRDQILTAPAVKVSAQALGIPVSQPSNQQELLTTLLVARPDILIVGAYGRILRPEVLESFPGKFLNVHASLLPKYRGASPIQAAILAGDQETGVTLMQINQGLDTGPILLQRSIPIPPDITTPKLSDRLAQVGSELLHEALPTCLEGEPVFTPQDDTQATMTRLLTKESGKLGGSEKPEQIIRMLRAFEPWPGVWLEINDQRVLLLAAHLEESKLIPDLVQLAGKKPVDWSTFGRDRKELSKKINIFLNKNGNF